MSANHATTVGRPCSLEVAAFAAEQGVESYLPRVLEMTERVFSSARRIEVLVEDDPDIEDRYLVIEVHGSLTVPEAVRANHRWHSEIAQCCPSTHAHLFRLGLRLG
jgi:hypothetical protein